MISPLVAVAIDFQSQSHAADIKGEGDDVVDDVFSVDHVLCFCF